MERTANMSYEDFAKFIIQTSDKPTEGLVLDAIKQAGGSDDDAAQALDAVKHYMDNTEVDTVDDPGKIVEDGRDPEESDTQGKTLGELAADADKLTGPDAEDQGVIIPKDDLGQEPDEFDKEDGEVLDDDKIDEATHHPENQVQLSGDEILGEIAKFTEENPAATDEDLKRHLFDMGVPGDKLREFMRGFELLKTTHRLAAAIFANVSASDAAQWAAANTHLTAEQIRNALYEAGVSDREADDAIASLPPKGVNDAAGDPGADDGSDPTGGDMGDDGMGMPDGPDGPVDDSLSQDDAPPDSLGDPDTDATMPSPDGSGAPDTGSDFDPVADQHISDNPDITPEELMEILQGEGASPEEAAQVAQAKLGQPPTTDQQVMTPKGAARVAHVYETLEGDVYMVHLASGETAYFGVDALSAYTEPKTSSTDIFGRIQAHVEENWYTEMDRLPHALKESYEKRLQTTSALRAEIREAIKTAAPDVQVELMRYDDALDNEECYCKDKLKNSFTLTEAEYITSRPQFNVSASHAGQEIGPKGGVLHMAALEAEQELAQIDWRVEVTAGADLFVEDIDSKFIADAGEVRKRAARHIEAKTAVLPVEEAKPLISTFMANVEKARKQAAIEARKNGPVKEAAVELPDDFEKGLFA